MLCWSVSKQTYVRLGGSGLAQVVDQSPNAWCGSQTQLSGYWRAIGEMQICFAERGATVNDVSESKSKFNEEASKLNRRK